ncbi:MAG TPA: heavy metal translocating P-type ATPase, partial [Lactobacillus acetotolerans]|nr:heavy metal translocating P-type ATPase [Lactobacillus acetotolerans]
MVIALMTEIIQDWKNGRYGVDILAVIAIVSTMLIGDEWASWMIMVMATGGQTLEDYATGQADRELRSLLNNSPTFANKMENGGIVKVQAEDLKIGDHVIVKPSQQVPVDGRIVKGTSRFDQSSLTGESAPVFK